MSGNFYVACDLSADHGRVALGSLYKGKLSICEIRRFQNQPVREKDSLQWNIPQLYHETLEGLRGIGAHEEPVDSISCSSWGADYLLFDSDGSLVTPTYHHRDSRTEAGMKAVFAKLPWEAIYEETGVQRVAGNTLFQLGAEKAKRLKRARLMPVADGFNYLLAGVPRVEMSLASTTQLYDPITNAWSDRLLSALELSPDLFPPLTAAGTRLGPLRPEISKETGLEDPQVVTSCSHEPAAALAGLPIQKGETWAYLQTGATAALGTELVGPIINEVSREWNFTNELGFGGSVHFFKQLPGLWILDECHQFWKEKDREIDGDLLMHLAVSAEPFESLIDFSDPRFLTPGDMPMKIQMFCRETGQTVPRKPGPTARCILESLALLYRKTLHELECLTGREFNHLYLIGGPGNSLLNHFTANALRLPMIIAPPNITSIGNVVVQALAMGHVKSLEEAREIVRTSFKTETIVPHAAAWDSAYNRLSELVSAGKEQG